MNVYMPYPDLNKSAEVMDDTRLSKVRADIVAVLKTCAAGPPSEDDKDHPAVKMWRGNERFLIQYGMTVCTEWMSRGNTDNTLSKIVQFRKSFEGQTDDAPEWFGDEAYHSSIRSQLLRNQPAYYRTKWDTPDDIALVWPRTPARQRKSLEDKQQEKRVNRAKRLLQRAQEAMMEAREAAIEAGLDPDTMESLDEVEADPELAAL